MKTRKLLLISIFPYVLATHCLVASEDATAPAASPKRMGFIDPAAFGFGQPGFVADFSMTGTQDFAAATGGLDFSELRLIAPLGVMMRNDFLLATSLGYNLTQVGFDGWAGLNDQTLHSLEAQVTLSWRPRDSRWSTLAFVTPGISSDLNRITGDDFDCSGLGLVNYRVSDGFTLSAGMFGRYEVDDAFLVPAAGFIWQNDAWQVQMTPPFAVIGYRASEQLTLSLSAYPSGGSWDLDDSPVNRVKVRGWQVAASVMYRLDDHWQLSWRSGFNVAGEVELFDAAHRSVDEEDLSTAPFTALNLRYLF